MLQEYFTLVGFELSSNITEKKPSCALAQQEECHMEAAGAKLTTVLTRTERHSFLTWRKLPTGVEAC